MDREAWHAAIHGVEKSRTRLSNWTELWCWISFYVLVGHLYIFLGEMSIQAVCWLFNYVIYLFVELYNFFILDTRLLSDIWFVVVFSHSLDCHFNFLIMTFDSQKVLTLFGIISKNWSLIYLFFLLLVMFMVPYLRIHCQIQCCENSPLCFHLKVLIVFSLLSHWSIFS